jgi:hypothetical protein
MRLSAVRVFWACIAAFTLGLAGCGGSTTSGGTAPSTPAVVSSAAAAASSAAGTAGSAVSSAGGAAGSAVSSARKVSANTASEQEITAALGSAGVSNPGRWAEEVVESRYNPGQETVDKIVSALQP